ncbi:MAG: hypothetical protein A2464_00405 [Deltaproteobacteria bacterium RIFOXYC2_FULL_48_10]|nr:MAG: hypothetical protein A2464_00405 [Deltaproteobacteria bacterium RIFOXYC2_FULL_48_10]
MEEIEISSLDLRYEGIRMKSPGLERGLFVSIMEHGIRDPLQGVVKDENRILLNGFKRYRCAKKLKMEIVPFQAIGSDEVIGLIDLLRRSNATSLNILEQARLIDELKVNFRMKSGEIAKELERSKAWVSVRMGIFGQMSDIVLGKIFNGEFPAYAYLYTIRQFMRINEITPKEIDEFVCAVSGRKLSVRDIEVLAQGYFMGSEELRQQILKGNLAWGLARLKESCVTRGCTEYERTLLKDLEAAHKFMQRISSCSGDKRLKSGSFWAQANILSEGILNQLDSFKQSLEKFHDRTRQTQGDLSAPPGRQGDTGDCPRL